MSIRYRGNEKESTKAEELLEKKLEGTIPEKIKLYFWDDLPEWQKDNSHIISGYVRETSSFKESIKSLTYLHNESVNIYTHLVPGVCFFLCIFYCLENHLGLYDTNSWVDRIVFALFTFGAAAALSLSSCFHLLKSHSEQVASFGNKLDYLGIIVLIVTSMVSILYYGLIDLPRLRLFFWCLTLVFGAICSVFSLRDKFRTQSWRPFRASMFVLFGLSGVLPIFAGAYILGYKEVCKRCQLSWIISEGILYILGAVLYAARVPERFLPGSFDMFGHSHQIFHVLVVIAACCHGKGLIGAYHYRHSLIA